MSLKDEKMPIGLRKDIVWVDYVKVICLFFVYFSHSAYYTETVLPQVCALYRPFYVDAFFVISGYLFFRNLLPDSGISLSLSLSSYKPIDNPIHHLFVCPLFPENLDSFFVFFLVSIIGNYNWWKGLLVYIFPGCCTGVIDFFIAF